VALSIVPKMDMYDRVFEHPVMRSDTCRRRAAYRQQVDVWRQLTQHPTVFSIGTVSESELAQLCAVSQTGSMHVHVLCDS
jgi:hypothetical protein